MRSAGENESSDCLDCLDCTDCPEDGAVVVDEGVVKDATNHHLNGAVSDALERGVDAATIASALRRLGEEAASRSARVGAVDASRDQSIHLREKAWRLLARGATAYRWACWASEVLAVCQLVNGSAALRALAWTVLRMTCLAYPRLPRFTLRGTTR